jgi:hypothetical protein
MNAMANMDYFSNFKSSLLWQASYSMLAGLFGSLLLVLFLTGLMPLSATVRYLPWILGFNACVAGYTLLDRTRDKLHHKKVAGMGVGFLLAVLVCIALNLLTVKMAGIHLMDWAEMLLFITIATVFGGLGAWLSLKYSAIKDN